MTDLTKDQRRGLAVAFRAAQWLLDDVAHDLPAGRVTLERWQELAEALDFLAALVKTQLDT